MNFAQSKLISGGTLKDYQLDGQNWLIQRYLFAMHGAIVSPTAHLDLAGQKSS